MKVFVMAVLSVFIISGSAFAQWTQTSGPEGGAAFAIFADGPNLYAGMASAGVFRSTDGGATWSQKINGMGYQTTAVIKKSGPYLLASGTVGLYRSTDDGENWTPATGLPGANGINSLDVLGEKVVAGSSGKGVYVSTDYGETWSAASTGLPGGGPNTYVGSVAFHDSTLLASASDWSTTVTIYRSTDFGVSWSAASSGLPADYSLYNTIHSDGATLYAGGSYLYKSTDGGGSWSQAESGIQNYSGISSIAAQGAQLYAGASNYLYRSTNGGASWSPAAGTLPLMNFPSVIIAGSAIYAGTIANGVYKSTDAGLTWTQIVSGLKARDMSEFRVDGTTLYGNGNSVFKTTDGGDTWNNVRGDLKDSSSQPTLVYLDGSTLFVRDSPAQGLERSTDGGATWTLVGDGLPTYGAVQSIVPAGSALLTATNGRVYKSTDNGTFWSQADSSISQFVYFNSVTRIGNSVYAHGMTVFRSTDEGATWIDSDSGMAAYFQVDAMASNGTYIFAGGQFSSSYYRSSNNGDTWQLRVNVPASGTISQFLGAGTEIFVSSPNNGIFQSTNNGNNWTKISTGLPNTNYRYSLMIHNGWIFAGTSGNGVWKRPLSDVTAVGERETTPPADFGLDQNYPNPFNPTTKISWHSPSGGRQTLKVYDILGTEVATLFNEEKPAGRYEIEFDASRLPSGVYFYRLQAERFVQTRKLVLLR